MIKDQRLYDRLVARMRVDERTGCWLWTGPYHKDRPWPQNRYGYIGVKRASGKYQSIGTHRAMMIAIHGELTPQQCACHRCDVPLCINPTHLFVGSMKDNIRDSRSKNRHHEAKKEFCDYGHPLSGENVYLTTQRGGIRRACKRCQKIRQRIKHGWPEQLARTIDNVPYGYRLDFATGEIIKQSARRRSPSANESHSTGE